MTAPTLTQLRAEADTAREAMQALIARKFPGCNEWNWYRALSAVEGKNHRRNDDTTNDAALAADAEIRTAHDEYIRLLHIFYTARDGAGGVLGGRL